MAKHLLKCSPCKQYTLKQICPSCQDKTLSIKPAKYSPEDPYGHYRRQAKKADLVAKGIL